MKKENNHGITLKFASKETLKEFIEVNLPFAVRPTKKAKTFFVAPFTSSNARSICINAIIDSLMKINCEE